jgi:arylsulfatase A-like enzyme
MKPFSRRDFLKLAALAPMAWFARPLLNLAGGYRNSDITNVIILVFDAWAAGHTSLYGYPRDTMPNLTRFAERALVYHNHYSAGTFTATGTASVLTGLYPWSHRALHIRSGIASEHLDHQIFSELGSSHTSLAYSQNRYADKFLYQMQETIDRHVSSSAFSIQNQSVYNLPIFQKDGEIAFAAFEENILHKVSDHDASLFFGPLSRLVTRYHRHLLHNLYEDKYPKGMPDSTELFLLEDLVKGTIDSIKALSEPYITYFHFFPPHWPYQPKKGVFKKFRDGWTPDVTAPHPLIGTAYDDDTLLGAREKYDEYLASWDDEIGRLFDYLQYSGTLDRSLVVITSDHGEMFERGVSGHTTPLIYNPLAHVPLVISAPGLTERMDIHANTSCADILPTLAHLTENPVPDWIEGEILPGLGGEENDQRGVYVVDAKENSAFAPLSQYSLSLTKDRYRLTHYNYPAYQGYEFYDLEADPGELQDLYPSQPSIALDMQQELADKINEVNRPYLRAES